MPEQIEFSTFLAVVISEFCLMCLWLMIIIERSIKRSFRYLDELAVLDSELDRVRTALLWFAGEKGRDLAMQYANALHDHIDKRDELSDADFELQKATLDKEYAVIMLKFKDARPSIEED